MKTLPFCNYPTSTEFSLHGLQKTPVKLPLVNLEAAKPYRSELYKSEVIDNFNNLLLLELARVMAESFALNEPMARTIELPKQLPENIFILTHKDDFGEHSFGEWSKENILFWIIRLFVLSDPTSPLEMIKTNRSIFDHSIAIRKADGKIIGGAFNLPVLHHEIKSPLRSNDPFLSAVYTWFQPIHQLLLSQDDTAIDYLCKQYSNFKVALDHNKVGIFFMVARSPLLPKEDAFELVAASIERFKVLGYEYVITAAANQWTGAAFEVMNGIRIHFAPYKANKTLKRTDEALPNEVSSSEGFLSYKDSGCMFYVLRLK